MPLNLDTCITGIFIPGNIGASSGQVPVVRVMPPRVAATLTVQINERATATAVTAVIGDVGAMVMETAVAVDMVYQAQIFDEGIGEFALATDAPSVFVPGGFVVAVTEAATAADAVDWVADTAFYGVLGIAGPIPTASPAPTIIYIEV